MPADEAVQYRVTGKIGWITMSQPGGGLTLMTTAIMASMRNVLAQAARDPAIRVIVLRSSGRSFMVGADLAFVRDASVAEFRRFARENQALASELRACPKIIVAGVNGHALGGGFELALACDVRVCAVEARLGFPEVSVGLLHSTGSSYLLSRMIGLGRAKELVLTGRQLDAAEALALGLVTSVVSRDDMDSELERIAGAIAANAPVALAWAKKIFDLGAGSDFGSALEIEEVGNVACFDTTDRVEAATAFFERRPPVFS